MDTDVICHFYSLLHDTMKKLNKTQDHHSVETHILLKSISKQTVASERKSCNFQNSQTKQCKQKKNHWHVHTSEIAFKRIS